MSVARFKPQAEPATPPSGYIYFYCDIADGLLYFKLDTGTVIPVKPVGGGTGDLLSDGSVPLIANWDVGEFNLLAEQFESTITSGDLLLEDGTNLLLENDDELRLEQAGPPLVVASAGLVVNLNADKIDGADLIDEDDMVSDSATAVPTQQSVKAYVDANGGIANVVEDTTPQLGGSLDVNGQKIVSVSDGNIDIEPHGTGNVLLGNFVIDADATIGAGQDNFVLTYDHASGTWRPEAGGSGGPLNNFAATTDPGVGDDDADGYEVGSWWFNTVRQTMWFCADDSTGAAVWLPIFGDAKVRVVAGTSDTLLTTDSGGIVVYTSGSSVAVTIPDTFPVEYHVTLVQAGAGVPTATRSGTDTVNGAATGVTPSAQWKGMYLLQYAAGTYLALK